MTSDIGPDWRKGRERDKEGEIEEDSTEQYIMTDTCIVHASNV